jgi:hypothetical protein
MFEKLAFQKYLKNSDMYKCIPEMILIPWHVS